MARPPRSHVVLSILPVGLAEAAACSLTVTAGKPPTIAPRVGVLEAGLHGFGGHGGTAFVTDVKWRRDLCLKRCRGPCLISACGWCALMGFLLGKDAYSPVSPSSLVMELNLCWHITLISSLPGMKRCDQLLPLIFSSFPASTISEACVDF